MRGAVVFLVALLLGALTVSGQDDAADEGKLAAEVARLTRLLERHRAARSVGVGQRLVQRVYEIGDLVAPPLVSRFEPAELRATGEEVAEVEVEDPVGLGVDALVDLLKTVVEPASWESVDGADIQPRGSARLFVTTTVRVHAGLERFLTELRRVMDAQVAVEIEAVAVSAEQAQAIGERPRELTPEQAQALATAPSLGSVRVVTGDLQTVAQRSGRSRSYLQGYDVQVAEGAEAGRVQRVELFEGCTGAVRAALDAGADGALLTLVLERTELEEPLRTVKVARGDLDLPVLDLTRVGTTLWAPLDRTVVVGGSTAGARPCLFLATARRVRANR